IMAEAEQVKFVLRLPPSLHKKIKRSAKANNTSMNKEITNILTESFSKSSMEKTLTDLVQRLEKKKVI
ncbi:MAG: Arc family DNA-binding protein, partial [Pseudomonadales bacterium]|nr:Arc family DNA-binding protein [Pseudomonadales bacterium]